MATNMLPILALGAAALFLMKKKGTPSTNGKTNGKANGQANGNGDALPGNVSLVALAPFFWGVKIGLGTDLTDDEATQVIDIVAKHAADFPALPFEVTLSEVPGIPVTIMANNVPKDYWAEDVSYLDPTLADTLAEHIPKP